MPKFANEPRSFMQEGILEIRRKLKRFSLVGLAAAVSLSVGTTLVSPVQSANPPSFELLATLNVPVAEIAAANNNGAAPTGRATPTGGGGGDMDSALPPADELGLDRYDSHDDHSLMRTTSYGYGTGAANMPRVQPS